MNKVLMMALFLASVGSVNGASSHTITAVNNTTSDINKNGGSGVVTLDGTNLTNAATAICTSDQGYLNQANIKFADLPAAEQKLYLLKTNIKFSDLPTAEQGKYKLVTTCTNELNTYKKAEAVKDAKK